MIEAEADRFALIQTKTVRLSERELRMECPGLNLEAFNNGFVVAINIEAREGEAEAVAAILQDLVAPTMAEAGVRLFLPYRSPTNPASFFIFELYAEEGDWGIHQETTHFKEAIKELLPRVAKRERVPFVPFVAG